MPIEIINPIPADILAGGTGGANYVLNSDAYDIAINGIPFLLATSDQRPYIREVQDIRKQMFDNFPEPGEYSMMEWWLRSQSDFGGGQGLTYQDPDVDDKFNIKFHQSTGINPWAPGEIQLLPNAIPLTTTLQSTSEGCFVRGYRSATMAADAAWVISNRLMKAYNPLANTQTAVNYDGGAGARVESLTASGNQYYVGTADSIWTGTDEGAGTKLWTFAAVPVNGLEIEWVKGRLMAGYNNKIYELVTPGGAPPFALPATPVFTHLDPTWQWSDIAEGPQAIYFSGDDGTTSSIYKLTLDSTTGAVPTLTSGGTIAASFPVGEIVHNIYCYLGTFLGISTNMGFRVGEISDNGDISYGPLLWTKPSFEILGYDRFFYVLVQGGTCLDPEKQDSTNPADFISGMYRVDLSMRTTEQTSGIVRYAYATDVYSNSGKTFRAVGILADHFLVGFSGSTVGTTAGSVDYWPTDREMTDPINGAPGTWVLVPSGWYQTGRVRYNTLEPKMFRFFSVRAPAPLGGNLDVDVIDDGGGVTRYITYTNAHPPDVGDIPLSAINTPKIYISLRFTLHRGAVTTTEGAVVNGWQIKALPAPIRQRIFTVPLQCFDHEQDKTGQGIGFEGYALERLQAMEQIAQKGNAILLQDLYNDIGAQVVIEQLQFVQTAAPGIQQQTTGGYLTLRMKTVSDVVG